MKLLLVEDNPRLAERIAYHLRKSYIIDIAINGKEALEKVGLVHYGVVLLDLGLPDMSGLEVCEKMRLLNFNNPILVLTGNGDMEDRVKLLNAGADDYVTKPFNTDELRARIAAVGRRQSRTDIRTTLVYGDIAIDLDRHKVTREQTDIVLRRKEFDILEYLILNKGRVMTRDMIMDHVWSSRSNSWTSTVDVHIKHLRDKIDKPFDTSYIKTAYGLGYKLEDL
ncbi:response regulator transcription factor [Candidatus Saccharibacteria bacterium]|nr:response regulator transcription factor [Candidatus Saccharibacteria bacterium]